LLQDVSFISHKTQRTAEKLTDINRRLPASKTDFYLNLQKQNTHGDHSYSSQRSVAIAYVVRSTIGYITTTAVLFIEKLPSD